MIYFQIFIVIALCYGFYAIRKKHKESEDAFYLLIKDYNNRNSRVKCKIINRISQREIRKQL